MNLYLDDDSAKGQLAMVLRKAGHIVVLPIDSGLAGASDARHLRHAVQHNLLLISRNYKDFLELHDLVQAVSGQHAGLLIIRSDNDPTRDMKDRDIARAIAKIQGAGVPIAGNLHILNHWR
jgi:predicted nuclease of predicted toxin-antitoxin system